MDVFVEYLQNRDQGISQDNQQLSTRLTLTTAQKLSLTLEAKLQQSKQKISQAINDNRTTYAEAIEQADRAQKTIAELLNGVDRLQALLGDEETGVYARLASAKRTEQLVSEQLVASTAVLGSLRKLAAVYADMQRMDAFVRGGELDNAAEILREMRTNLSGSDMMGAAMGGTKIEGVLAQRLEMASVDIRDKTLAGLKRAISIQQNNDKRLSIRMADSHDAVKKLMRAASALDAAEQIQRGFGSYFIAAFVRPLLTAESATTSERSNSDTGQMLSVFLHEPEEHSDSKVCICDAILGAMQFVASFAGQAQQIWEPSSVHEICQLVARQFVTSSSELPASRKALLAYSTNEETLKLLDFETALFALCQTQSRETAAENNELDPRPICQAVGRIAELYTEHHCTQALARARRLAEDTSFAVYAMHTHELWCADLVRTLVMADSADNGENLDRLSELISKLLSEEKIGLEPMVFPQCSISKSIHELVTLAYSLANEALSASQAEFPAWLSALGDALATYCALFPVLHGSELQKVPALGWQFVNDCMYAAHHASLLAQTIAQLSDHPARSFLGAGNKQRQLLIQRQTEELAMQAHGPDDMFFAASTENSQQALARAVKQTRATLEHLARGMRPPATTPHVYYTAMGQCIDAVFETTIKGIFDLRDIGVDDSQALSDHCRRVLSLTALLPLDQQVLLPYTSLGAAHDGQGAYANDVLLAESDDDNDDDDDDDGDDESENDKGSVAQQRLGDQYCRLKDKLLQLADILVISRADILARRRAGLLAQFTVDELVRLVRALFSDTSERARDIEMLKTI